MQALAPTPIHAKQISAFSRPEIEAMPDSELVTVIKAAQLPFLTGTDLARLSLLGRESLLRLGFLSREFCRNQSRDSRWSALSE